MVTLLDGSLETIGTWYEVPRRGEGRVIVEGKFAERRCAAVRAGWNDAAWGQSRHDVDPDLAVWYERGYTGGLIYRQKDQHDGHGPDKVVVQPRALAAG